MRKASVCLGHVSDILASKALSVPLLSSATLDLALLERLERFPIIGPGIPGCTPFLWSQPRRRARGRLGSRRVELS